MEKMGVMSICIKDMAGIMSPQEAYDLVKAIKAEVKLPVVVHTHSTTGLGALTLQKAVEAGADVIDTAISCFSGGTSQPPTETLVYAPEVADGSTSATVYGTSGAAYDAALAWDDETAHIAKMPPGTVLDHNFTINVMDGE